MQCLAIAAGLAAGLSGAVSPAVRGSPVHAAVTKVAAQSTPALDHPHLAPGVFIIARAGMDDPSFSHAVILITHYDEDGTTGLVINRTLEMAARDMLPPLQKLNVDAGFLHFGGPVAVNALQLLVRTGDDLGDAQRLFDGVYIIARFSVLNRLLGSRLAATDIRVFAGYAGWAAGQLESEIVRGDWYLWRAEATDIFDVSPDSVWPRLIQAATAQWAEALPAPRLAHPGGASIMRRQSAAALQDQRVSVSSRGPFIR